MRKRIEPLNCPFCGKAPQVKHWVWPSEEAVVVCDKCKIESFFYYGKNSRRKAIKWWSRRNENPYLEPVIATICEQLCIPDENLSEDSHLEHDCGLDSLDLSELVIALEVTALGSQFDVIVEDETLESWETVGDIASFLLKELGDPNHTDTHE